MRLMFLLSMIVVAESCQVKPQPIEYGKDGCHFCKMTIVDNQHAAEIVTVKGKAFKYDAIECMMNHLNKWNGPEIKYYLVADYSSPGSLTDGITAHYLISESIPSPMGAFLTAFESEGERSSLIATSGGESLTWHQLQARFRNK